MGELKMPSVQKILLLEQSRFSSALIEFRKSVGVIPKQALTKSQINPQENILF